MSVVSPYGTWASPITTRMLVADSVRLGGLALDGDLGQQLARHAQTAVGHVGGQRGQEIDGLVEAAEQLGHLPEPLRSIAEAPAYEVRVSDQMKALAARVDREFF